MIKRAFDIVASATAMVVLSPAFAAVAINNAVNGQDNIYTVDRLGRGGAPFKMYKFKTMNDDCDPQTGELLPDEDRVYKGAKWIRAAGLDELPQLWNILKGDMSFVGPRPHSPEEGEHYRAHGLERVYDHRPGLTGPWQVYAIGRRTSFEEHLTKNADYTGTLREDASLLARTPAVLVKGHDIG